MTTFRLSRALRAISILSIMVLFIGCGGGGGGGSADSENQEKVIVSGRVLDSNGIPVPSATVTIESNPVIVTTEMSGSFSAEVYPGNHTIKVSMGGVTFYQDTFTAGAGAPVSLGDLYPSTPYYFESTDTTYRISGTITVSGGGALGGVTITLAGASTGTATTNASGNYSFTGLDNGSYTITPSITGYTFTPASRTVTINNADLSAINFSSSVNTVATYSISGTITLSSEPNQGITVTLYNGGSPVPILMDAITNANGGYQFTGLVNGTYTITPSSGSYTFTPESKTVNINNAAANGIDFTSEIYNIPTYSISGSIKVDGVGKQGFPVILTFADMEGTIDSLTTDANGNYSFTGLYNRAYIVAPSPCWYTFTPASRAVTVNGGNVSSVNFTATLTNPRDHISDILNSLVSIPGGTFSMGSTDNENGRAQYTTPVHQVTLQGFEMGAYEITRAQYAAVMNDNYYLFWSQPGTENLPINNIKYSDAQQFCEQLSLQTGGTFTLPSEAQWEYACRAGSTTLYSFGNDDEQLQNYGWYVDNAGNAPYYLLHSIGMKLPNPWGLYDMQGNVAEMCLDSWHSTYTGAPIDGTAWAPGTGSSFVKRGGASHTAAYYCRSADRVGQYYNYGDPYVGIRVVTGP